MFSKLKGTKAGELIIWTLLTMLCLFVAAKVMLIGFSADEEYQLILTYRLAKGDMLFREVWDTLQTSAFYGQFFMWLYLKVAHTTTGCLLFLRFCGVVTQGCVSLFLFFTLKKHLKFNNALFLSAAFFCTYTKLVSMPEFSNMQTWSLVVMLCAIWRAKDAFESDKKKQGYLYLSAAALFFCAAVLSAACVILIPVIFILLLRMQEKGGMKRNLLFWGICLFCGAVYVITLLAINGLDILLFGINGVLTGDDTHLGGVLLNGNQKWADYLQDAGIILAYMAVTLLIAVFISYVFFKITKKKNDFWMLAWIMEAYAVTLYNWFAKKIGYEGLKLYIPVLSAIGIYVFFRHFHSVKDGQAQKASMLPAFYGIVIGIGVFANVLLISNVGVTWNITFLNTSALWGMVILVSCLEKNDAPVKHCLMSGLFCLVMIAGTGLTLNAGPFGSTVFDVERVGRMQEGPTKGVLVSNTVAHAYADNFKLFRELVKENSNVLIVTNFFHNQSLTPIYMLNGVNISHYTVNSTPTYSDKLYEYWEKYPERMPDCIVINGDSCLQDDYLWALDLISKYDEMVEVTLYSVRYFVRPECVKEEYFSK